MSKTVSAEAAISTRGRKYMKDLADTDRKIASLEEENRRLRNRIATLERQYAMAQERVQELLGGCQ